MPKKTTKAIKAKVPKILTNDQSRIVNGFSEAILGFNPGSIGTELTQVDTLFINLRWYLISNFRQALNQAYAEHGLIQTVVDVPVDDGLRGGVKFKTGQLSPDDLKTLYVAFEREDILNSGVGRGLKWDRLFGGAGIIILTDQDPTTELDVAAIGSDSNLEFRAVDLWELFWDKQNVEGFNPAIQEPAFDFYNYYGRKVHKSRVMKLKGKEAPSFIRPRLRGWGLSVVESIISSINQYFKMRNVTFEVLDEFKIDVYRFKNLASTLLQADGQAAVQRRVQATNKSKNFQNAIILDVEDEYAQKQLNFSGIAEIAKDLRIQLASELRFPLTKLFGISAAGFSSGEDDIEVYNAMVESEVRAKARYHILKIGELMCQKLFGFVPEDLELEFKPLRILGAEQEENVKTQKFNRLLAAVEANRITTAEFRDGCNSENLLPIELQENVELEAQSTIPTEEQDKVDAANRAPSKSMFNESDDLKKDYQEFWRLTTQKKDELQDRYDNAVQNPGSVDEALWKKAKRASVKALGVIKYPFVTYMYEKSGGVFK